MLDVLSRRLLDPSGLTPHGFCLLWEPWLIWTHALSDIGIGFAYLTIPLALVRFARRRHDLVFKPIFLLFAAFILLCGTSHLLSLITIWIPAYGIEAVVKTATAIVSLATAVAIWILMPQVLTMPSQAQMQAANDALRESEALHRMSFEDSPALLFVLDQNDIVTRVSNSWLRLLGYERAEVVGRYIRDFWKPGPTPLDAAHRLYLLEHGQYEDLRCWYMHRNGTVVDALVSARVFQQAQSSMTLCVMVDVTERTRVETALRESEKRSRLALSAVNSSGTWDWDVVNDRIYADASFAGTFGVDPARAAAGASLSNYLVNVPTKHRGRITEEYANAMRTGGDCSVTHPLTQPDGSERWFLAKSHCTLAPDGTPLRMLGILIDITTQHRLEEQLRQSQKMEAVGQLTGGVAHDFNNMLQGIIGSLEMLKAQMEKGDFTGACRYIDAGLKNAGRAATLTQRLLAFSRQQVLDPRLVDSNVLIANMRDLIQSTVGPEITVVTAPALALWTTMYDRNQMENALLNLCINARDAMPRGGQLTVETRNITLDKRGGFEWDMIPGQYVAISVTDSGIGMSAEVVARAFDPFFTTKPMGEGTGLGLSMIYGFAQQSGGQAQIWSNVGVGTTVWIYLPRHPDAQDDKPKQVEEKHVLAFARTGETILIVDDEPTVRMLVTEVLQEQGYAVIEAADGASGLKVLQSDVRIDLLISDVGLPNGMNGRQMADVARNGRPDLKVLFITGYSADAAIGNSRLSPGMEVLTKPFALDVLAAKIEAIIRPQSASAVEAASISHL